MVSKREESTIKTFNINKKANVVADSLMKFMLIGITLIGTWAFSGFFGELGNSIITSLSVAENTFFYMFLKTLKLWIWLGVILVVTFYLFAGGQNE